MKIIAKRGLALLFAFVFACAMFAAAAVSTAAAAVSMPSWTPTVRVTVSGRDMVAGEFMFLLKEDGGLLQSPMNNADGSIPFTTINYTTADIGIHVYTISEQALFDPSIGYDTHEITYTVEVKMSGGMLVAEEQSSSGSKTFTNIFLGTAGGGETSEEDTTNRDLIDAVEDQKNILDKILDGLGSIGSGLGTAWDKFGEFVEWVMTAPDRFDEWLHERSLEKASKFLKTDLNIWWNNHMKNIANNVYKTMYPFGVAVLVVAWAAGVMSSGITLSLDPGNKYSLIRAGLQLLIGMVLLSVMPKLLGFIFSLCNQLHLTIAEIGLTEGHGFITTICELMLYLLVLRATLLQCIAPIFAGAAAGGETMRRMAINFIKEYIIICMQLPFMTIYIILVDRMMGRAGIDLGLIASIVIAVSVFTVNKHLEKLFH